MTPGFARSLDALGEWRGAVLARLDALARGLAEHDLLDPAGEARIGTLRERLAHEKLVVAFVAEFSRGKSELINAIFFADTGRRVLPATPGRTTMCPVELSWQAGDVPSLRLLPIQTRLEGLSLAELRGQDRAWRNLPLDVDDPDALAATLQEVTRTEWVEPDQARALGFWHDDDAQRNPPVDERGRVEVPAWRHALIRYPHPILRQGLVVLDTPGLNAIGAEPELTVSLLPSAHATVFVLGADTGVTQSDRAVWTEHLGVPSVSRFVVLNKIDALADPLIGAAAVAAQIDAQQQATARTLGMPAARVFPLSARQALTARVRGEAHGLAQSRLPAFEAALGAELLPQRRQLLETMVVDAVRDFETTATRRFGDARRQVAEQLLELRGLRGKSGPKVRLMLSRVDAENAEFEACTSQLAALASVHRRLLKEALAPLSNDRLRDEVATMVREMDTALFKFGARKAFAALCTRLRRRLASAARNCVEIHDMLGASFTRLNAQFGFGLAVNVAPELGRFDVELRLIESAYVQYLGLGHALRLSNPRAMEQFRRMLVGKLRLVFEGASGEVDLWSRSGSAQVEAQLRDRRRGFARRRETLERIQEAAGELETRLAELEAQDERAEKVQARVRALGQALCEQARALPRGDTAEVDIDVDVDLPARERATA
ncbi:MAG: dynamin family protein [Burkholderiaceae bacterium]